MKADGTILECSESSNVDVFQAARVHLGCLGVILTVTLQCVPQFHLQETSFPSTLKEVLAFCLGEKGFHFTHTLFLSWPKRD